MGTCLLLALFVALAYRLVGSSYPRPCRESRFRGLVAALGATLGGALASVGAAAILGDPMRAAWTVAALVGSMALGGFVLAIAALVGLVALEDGGMRVPA